MIFSNEKDICKIIENLTFVVNRTLSATVKCVQELSQVSDNIPLK